jgi:hypothetical protein
MAQFIPRATEEVQRVGQRVLSAYQNENGGSVLLWQLSAFTSAPRRFPGLSAASRTELALDRRKYSRQCVARFAGSKPRGAGKESLRTHSFLFTKRRQARGLAKGVSRAHNRG